MDRQIYRIKVILADKEKTNRWLAILLGKDSATVRKWYANTAQPSLETMMQIAKLLEVDMNELVRFETFPEITSPNANGVIYQ